MKPIIFSTPMVKATLDGTKTKTRRIIKPQPHSGIRRCPFVPSGVEDIHGNEIKVKYRPDDILYVRETWNTYKGRVVYRAGEIDCGGELPIKWKPSIHMPKKYARIFLVIKEVRIEKLQDITEEGSVKEGIKVHFSENKLPCIRLTGKYPPSHYLNKYIYGVAKAYFASLWDSLNAKRGYPWASNPWVWVIEFERIPYDNSFMYKGKNAK